MRKLRVVGAALAAMMVWAAPAYAGPPDRAEFDISTVIPDEQHGLAVFVNITREACCAWAADDFEGPAPVEQLVTAQFKEVGQGALVVSAKVDTSIEMWRVDEFGDEPCEDTAGQEAPWASGHGRWTLNDNDFDVSLTRTNVFGEVLRGSVVDADGHTWRYLAIFRAHIDKDEDFRVVVEKSNLVRTGK